MLQYLLYDLSFDDTPDVDTPEPPLTPPRARTAAARVTAGSTIPDATLLDAADLDAADLDADPPLFALLCSQLGLELEVRAWAPPASSPGRHIACVLDGTWTVPVPVVADPSIALLERTLASLRSWEPSA